MCAWTPTGWRPAIPAIFRYSSLPSSIGTPNLLIRRPVEMWGCAPASMSGLRRTATRARVPRLRARASIRASSPGDSALIDRRPSGTARAQLVRRLADAGEDQLPGDEPGTERDVDLAPGIGVGAAARVRGAAAAGRAWSSLSAHSGWRAARRRTPRRIAATSIESPRRCRRTSAYRSSRRCPRAGRRRTTGRRQRRRRTPNAPVVTDGILPERPSFDIAKNALLSSDFPPMCSMA